ncbi:hypothetical protein CC2G_008627 [Coprinopsis cinerea AmutBmut pab1-1]|nr:hypothetical protein CC2G_008627 [Coprinopsis cinerea AmutBmut pab1-1]
MRGVDEELDEGRRPSTPDLPGSRGSVSEEDVDAKVTKDESAEQLLGATSLAPDGPPDQLDPLNSLLPTESSFPSTPIECNSFEERDPDLDAMVENIREILATYPSVAASQAGLNPQSPSFWEPYTRRVQALTYPFRS